MNVIGWKKNNKLNSVDLRVGKINVYVPNINFSEKTKQNKTNFWYYSKQWPFGILICHHINLRTVEPVIYDIYLSI